MGFLRGLSLVVGVAVGAALIHNLMLKLDPPGDDDSWSIDASAMGVDDWGPDDVARFIKGLAPPPGPQANELVADALDKAADHVVANRIDGDYLLHVIANDMDGHVKAMGLGRPGSDAAETFKAGLRRKVRGISDNPVDFWEYRAAHRDTVLLIESAMLSHPRGLLVWLESITQDDVLEGITVVPGGTLAGQLVFWLGLWLLPNTLVATLAMRGWWQSPWLATVAIITAASNEAEQVRRRARDAARSIMASRARGSSSLAALGLAVVKDMASEAFGFVLTTVILWYIAVPLWRTLVPWFLSDLDIYAQMTIIPVTKLVSLGYALANQAPPEHMRAAADPLQFAVRQLARGAAPAGADAPVVPAAPPDAHWPAPLDIPDHVIDAGGWPGAMECAITRCIMKRPAVVVPSGITYEYDAIATWHRNSGGRDPTTNTPFRVPEDLRPNYALRSLIEQWVAEHSRPKAD